MTANEPLTPHGNTAAARASATAVDLAARVLGDLRAVSRLLSWIEDENEHIDSALDATYRHAGKAHVIGVTGVPGAGKSTLIARMAAELRRMGKTVGILAIDPSSALTGGAILGDRVRMSELASDPGIFIRSMATRGRQGGLARTTLEAIDVLDAAGFDTVIVETVGVGQDEFEIRYAAQTTVVVSVPGLGDAVQSIKAGLLEMADIHVVNKADRPDSNQTLTDLSGMLAIVSRDRSGKWTVPVLATSAQSGSGVDELIAALEGHRRFLLDSGEISRQRAKFCELRVWRGVEEMAVHAIRERLPQSSITAVLDRVTSRQTSPRNAARYMLAEARK